MLKSHALKRNANALKGGLSLGYFNVSANGNGDIQGGAKKLAEVFTGTPNNGGQGRTNVPGNSGRYNKKPSDSNYSDEFLKWWYDE